MKNNYIPFLLLLCFGASSFALIWFVNEIPSEIHNNLGLEIDPVNRATASIIVKAIFAIIGQIVFTIAAFIILFFKLNQNNQFGLNEEVYTEDINREIKKINLEKKVNEELQSDDFRFEEHVTSILPNLSPLSIGEFADKVIQEIAKKLEAAQAAVYIKKQENLEFIAGYAFHKPDNEGLTYALGEGLAGQVAKAKQTVNINNIPDGYIQVISGLGQSSPTSLLIVPLIHDNKIIGVVEIASFKKFSKFTIKSIERVCQEVCKHLAEKI